ncbi:MAG: hypothetical protein V4582_04845 [Pseudomonadota bacterium]
MPSSIERCAWLALAALCASAPAQADQQAELQLWQAYAPQGRERSSTELQWRQQFGGNWSEQWHWALAPELRLDSAGRRAGVAAWTNPDAPAAASVQQAYIGYRQDGWQLRAGKQVFDWSVTDTISPADVINPRDWSDITRVRKLAVPSLSLRYGQQTSLEWVWVPRQQVSTMPAGPWLPQAVSALLAPAQRHDGAGQHGLRLSGNWLQTDWALIAYRGHSNAPDLALQMGAQGPVLQPFYQALQAQALTLARQVGERNMMRLEVAHKRQANGVNFVQAVIGGDLEMSGLANDGDTLYALIQYADSNQHGTVRNALGWPDFQRVLERNVQVKLSYDPHSDRRQLLELSGTYNHAQRDSYWQLSYQRRLTPNLNVTAALAMAGGSADTFWGQYRDTSRATLQWHWRY